MEGVCDEVGKIHFVNKCDVCAHAFWRNKSMTEHWFQYIFFSGYGLLPKPLYPV